MRYFLGAIWAGIGTALDSLFFARDAMSFPLPTLLEVRRRDEERVQREVGEVTAARRRADDEQRRLKGLVEVARARVLALRVGEPAGAAEALARERFRVRLAGALEAAETALQAHAAGPLATAIAAEGAARTTLAGLVAGRRALERRIAVAAADGQRIAARRADEVAAEVGARLAGHRSLRRG
jgi:hypothetical protein